jgi:hypothetical protein
LRPPLQPTEQLMREVKRIYKTLKAAEHTSAALGLSFRLADQGQPNQVVSEDDQFRQRMVSAASDGLHPAISSASATLRALLQPECARRA